ncbi:hypothetical protein V5O48_012527 [Marasmius crinis-equi]|uniref:Uncharacterized protein n=1 Tax=Marasmius crinis-equi TaxID=585013 RepID=A0ABR3F2K3_9AGAR
MSSASQTVSNSQTKTDHLQVLQDELKSYDEEVVRLQELTRPKPGRKSKAAKDAEKDLLRVKALRDQKKALLEQALSDAADPLSHKRKLREESPLSDIESEFATPVSQKRSRMAAVQPPQMPSDTSSIGDAHDDIIMSSPGSRSNTRSETTETLPGASENDGPELERPDGQSRSQPVSTPTTPPVPDSGPQVSCDTPQSASPKASTPPVSAPQASPRNADAAQIAAALHQPPTTADKDRGTKDSEDNDRGAVKEGHGEKKTEDRSVRETEPSDAADTSKKVAGSSRKRKGQKNPENDAKQDDQSGEGDPVEQAAQPSRKGKGQSRAALVIEQEAKKKAAKDAVALFLHDPRDENRISDTVRVYVKKAVTHCPEAATSCWELARDVLVSRRSLTKCIYHYAVDKSNEKTDKSAGHLIGIPYEAREATTIVQVINGKKVQVQQSGSYNRMNLRENGEGELYCDCGCRLDDAIWGLFLWKTGRIGYLGQEHGYELTRIPTPEQRNFEITRLKRLGIELDDMWTHEYDATNRRYRRRAEQELLSKRLVRVFAAMTGSNRPLHKINFDLDELYTMMPKEEEEEEEEEEE